MSSAAPEAKPSLRTERLLLRPWRDSDREPFAAMNADPRVMEFMPATLTRAESDAFVERIEACFARHGFGFWAVEVPGVTPFAGFVGLSVPNFEAHFTPCVEAGWRIDPRWQGRGYATEGARAALAFGFEHLGLAEIVAFTTHDNLPSRNVMAKLGMRHDPAEDFVHPKVPPETGIGPLVLYRASAAEAAER